MGCEHRTIREIGGTGFFECVECVTIFPSTSPVWPAFIKGRLIVPVSVQTRDTAGSGNTITFPAMMVARVACPHPWERISWDENIPRCGDCNMLLQATRRKTMCGLCGTFPILPYCSACFEAANARANAYAQNLLAMTDARDASIAQARRATEKLVRLALPAPELLDDAERTRHIRLG